jgi:hypothetical protein
MAAPNLIATTSIIGRTHAESITASPLAALSNAIGSNQVYRVNVLYVTNLGGGTATVTVDFYRGSTSYKLAVDIPVPLGAPIVIVGKDTGIYLEEGDSLRIWASQAGLLQYLVSYEVMS